MVEIRNSGVKITTAENTDLIPIQKASGLTGRISKADFLSGISASGSSGGSRGYFNQVMADYPDYYFRLGETAGNTANDISGFSRSGTYSGIALNQASLLIGDSNPSAYFNGSGFISIPNIYAGSNFNFLSGLTLECIGKFSNIPHGYLISIGQNNATTIFNGFTLLFNNGKLAFDVHGITQLQSRFIAGAGTYHAAVAVAKTFDSNSLSYRIFLNGVIVGTGSSNCNTPNTIAYIGKADWGGNVTAFLDEVTIYGCELPANRIYAHYKASLLAA